MNKVTKKDLNKVYVRNLFGFQWGWNYEKMQGLGYCWTIMPALKAIYKDDPEQLKNAMKTELGYFNTTPAMSPLILGTDIALQEEHGVDKIEDTIVSVKAGLMGPFAGVGDTIFITVYRAIVFSIAAGLALEGSAIGMLIALVCGVAIMALRYRFMQIGYKSGQKLATEFSGMLKMVTEAASILALVVVGALIASVVNISLPFAFTAGGESLLDVQGQLNRILPGALPLALTMFSYWLLGKKGMTSTKLIFVLMAIGIVLGIFIEYFGV